MIKKGNMSQVTVQGNSKRFVIKHRGLIAKRIMLITVKGIQGKEMSAGMGGCVIRSGCIW